MANVQEAIRRLRIESTTSGVTQATEQLRAYGKAHEGVAVASQRNERAQQSLDGRFAGLERRFMATTRAQQDYEKVQRQVNAAVAQNPALQARANAVLAAAAVHFDQVSRGQRAFSAGMHAANDNLTAFAASGGLVARTLVTLGPAGLAAAAGLGALVLTMRAIGSEAARFADEMGKLHDTAQIIDLTTTQLQALNDAGSEFALTPDKIATGLQRFTAQLEEARHGQGELFQQIQRINPALAMQLAQARGTADALGVYAEALNKADTAQRLSLQRAGLGRGGFDVGQLIASVGARGGVVSLTEEFRKSGDAIDNEMIVRVRKLKREIDDMASDARNNIASVFSVQTLQLEKQFVESWLDFSRSMKSFSLSGDFRYLLETILKIRLGGPGTLLGAMGIDYRAGYTAPLRPDTFAERFQPANDNPLRLFDPSGAARESARLELDSYRQRIAVLGEAATASEKVRMRREKTAPTEPAPAAERQEANDCNHHRHAA